MPRRDSTRRRYFNSKIQQENYSKSTQISPGSKKSSSDETSGTAHRAAAIIAAVDQKPTKKVRSTRKQLRQ
jgi:hypothetical protein